MILQATYTGKVIVLSEVPACEGINVLCIALSIEVRLSLHINKVSHLTKGVGERTMVSTIKVVNQTRGLTLTVGFDTNTALIKSLRTALISGCASK